MISMPEDVLSTGESGGWDGWSVDSATGYDNPNKETKMDWAEHQRIVFNARSLLAGPIETTPSDVKKAFRELQSAYTDAASRSVVKVSKGIHQPFDKPHLQLRMVTTFTDKGVVTAEVVRKFHLYVNAINTLQKADAFEWKGVQFSLEHNGKYYYWPLSSPIIVKQRGAGRRNSVSSVDLEAHVAAVAEAKRQAERIAAEEARAAKAQSFEAAWEEFLTGHRLQNDQKYKTAPAKFKAGSTVMSVKGGTLRGGIHVKYDPVTIEIYQTDPTGTRRV